MLLVALVTLPACLVCFIAGRSIRSAGANALTARRASDVASVADVASARRLIDQIRLDLAALPRSMDAPYRGSLSELRSKSLV